MNLQTRSGVGKKVVAGTPKESLLDDFWHHSGGLGMQFEYLFLGYCSDIQYLFLRYSSDMATPSFGIHHVFFRYSFGTLWMFSWFSLDIP